MLTLNGLRIAVVGGIVMATVPIWACVPIGLAISLSGIALIGHGLNLYPVLYRIVAPQ
jgi:hypothetical protein